MRSRIFSGAWRLLFAFTDHPHGLRGALMDRVVAGEKEVVWLSIRSADYVKNWKLKQKFGKKEALSDVNMELDSGIYGLLGDNGAGKSTLMRLLVGVDTPTRGYILYEGEDISQLKGKYRGLLGYMPQEFTVFPGFTAGEF